VRGLVITWAPGGNLPPLVAAAGLLTARGHEVEIMCSTATRAAFEAGGYTVHGYRRTPDPVTRMPFEAQAESMLRLAAGADIALDVRDLLAEGRFDVAVVDCMLPAAISTVSASDIPVASLVHFLYGPVRRQLLAGGGWTTDLSTLADTHRQLGFAPVTEGLVAWESPELLLVTAPRWFDLDVDYPANVVHAGPLGVRRGVDGERTGVLLSFSTTVMEGQRQMIQRVCEAIAIIGVPAILTLDPALDIGDLELADNIELLPFADHDELLPGRAAVVTHGGLGTTLRALAHGVPLLVLPLGRDQDLNAERVSVLGAGTRVHADATPHQIGTGLTSLMADPKVTGAAARTAERMAAATPDAAAAEAIERIARARPG
jgi:UDP:flavonoid glycosyltransferase YjiC (YdhE family)